jgi:NAD(P)H-hydrate repair Nnr-like enzyme with NAD(P)H-hydrate dehydratase domain
MNNITYWHKQTPSEPLYKDFSWNIPERKTDRGKIGIVGGQKAGFSGVSESYRVAKDAEVGQLRVLLPDALKKSIPLDADEVVFGPTNLTGGLAKESANELLALGDWADVMLMIGDAGRSSETSIAYEEFLLKSKTPTVITRDSFDILRSASAMLAGRENTLLVLSFAQLQKLFNITYYPIVLTFGMQLTQTVEAMHKFTISYPVSLAVLHQETLIIAHGGDVTTTKWDKPMDIWRGITASKMAVYWTFKKEDPLQCFTAAVV